MMNDPVMRFWQNTVGRKLLIALTGILMVLFVVLHALGNTTLYFNWINVYAEHLHSLPALLWAYRVIMLAVLSLHIIFGILVTFENTEAKPVRYVCKRSLQATFASGNMIWTGLAIGVYLVFHILHFTAQVITPGFSASRNADAMGRPDIYEMIIRNFLQSSVSAIYIVAMIALGLHLTHGIQSLFQTLGLSNERSMPAILKVSALAALALALLYISIPVLVLAGILKG